MHKSELMEEKRVSNVDIVKEKYQNIAFRELNIKKQYILKKTHLF